MKKSDVKKWTRQKRRILSILLGKKHNNSFLEIDLKFFGVTILSAKYLRTFVEYKISLFRFVLSRNRIGFTKLCIVISDFDFILNFILLMIDFRQTNERTNKFIKILLLLAVLLDNILVFLDRPFMPNSY